MNIIGFNREQFILYIQRQISFLVPDDYDSTSAIELCLDQALEKVMQCINQIKLWNPGVFDPLHSSQYATFIYFLANTIWRETGQREVPLRLFLLNKALNSIDCFYEIELPPVFFIGHSIGIVLAKATYGNHLVLYQNTTVGKNHGDAPIIEDGVILYPNSAVIGKSLIRSGSVISQGVSVINKKTDKNMIVYQGAEGSLLFKSSRFNILSDYFHNI